METNPNQTPPPIEKSSSLLTTSLIIIISTIVLLFFYKNVFGSSKNKKKNSILIIGPAQSGKTSFFYNLIGKDQTETVTSMQLNEVQSYQSKFFKKNYDIVDIPGLGFFKDQILQRLPESKVIVLFVDSSERSSVVSAGEYLYDILNSDKYNEEIPFVICCNKQDLNLPKTKKMIENDLTTEIENIKTIKQKNNLDDREQMGALFQMKKKFTFALHKNVSFVETDKKSSFATLIMHINKVLEENTN